MPKVAAIQFTPVFKDKIGNLRRSARLVMTAAESGASLIVLPELAHEGYSFMRKSEAEPFCEILSENSTRPDTSMGVMSALSKKFGVYIAWGLCEKDPGTGSVYNTQVLMGPDGLYESYRKVNRFGSDYLWARPGRGNPPVMKCTLDGHTKKVGLLICRDVRDKKDSHWDSFYEKGDAELVAFSANWGKGGFPANAWMDFVEDNKVTLIVSNRCKEEIPNDFGYGGTCIIEPPDVIHCDGLVWGEDCIVYADI